MCDRNSIKSKVSTFEELYDFFYFCTVNIVTLCGGNVYSNVFDTAVKADVFRRYLFRIVEIIHIIKRIAGKFRYVCVNAVYALNAYFRCYFSVTHIDRFNINVVIVTACGVVQFLHNRLFVDCSVCGFAVLYVVIFLPLTSRQSLYSCPVITEKMLWSRHEPRPFTCALTSVS